jgi:hypothetical protein
MKSAVTRILEIAAAALVCGNIGGMIGLLVIRSQVGLYREGTAFPYPHGYLLDKSFLSRRSPCYLLRVSSDGCEFCRVDVGYYRALSDEAQNAGCESVLVAPEFGSMKALSGGGEAVQLQFVDMKLGRILNPFLTPQTILLTSGDAVAWSRDGALDTDSLRQGLQALRRLR